MATYVYGPVHSRRLGLSLGVDLVPDKTCSFNCLYCQLGPTDQTTVDRDEYVPVDAVVAAVRKRLSEIDAPDYVTLGGSGEPTLHSRFGEVARRIHDITDVPVCLISNSSLFYLPEVREACRPIDLIIPSLDAPDAETFERVNRSHPDITFSRIVNGLEALREEYEGEMWLEIFLLRDINDSEDAVDKFGRLIDQINPDRVQLNTVARPPAEESALAVLPEHLAAIRSRLGGRVEVIAHPDPGNLPMAEQLDEEKLLQMLHRRPCTVEDITGGLGVHRQQVIKSIRRLEEQGQITSQRTDDKVFYRPA